MKMDREKVAVVTGANAGIGLTLCELLLAEHDNLQLCLVCRNQTKAEIARNTLLLAHPEAVISVVISDISNVNSVYQSAKDIRKLYTHIDFLYLNAGTMPVKGVKWKNFFKNLFSSNCVYMMSTGSGVLNCEDDVTSEGLRQVFATNVFGHFVLIKELEDLMGGPDQPTRIIWTSSSAASKNNFDINDIQHENGNEPYKSSKYAVDLLSLELNTRWNKQNIYSHSVCPGLVTTNLTLRIMPWWFWKIMFPCFCFMRIVVPSLTCTVKNGCEALIWLSKQEPETLDPGCKFHSNASVFGRTYVTPKKMALNASDASKLYEKLTELEMEFREKYKKKDY